MKCMKYVSSAVIILLFPCFVFIAYAVLVEVFRLGEIISLILSLTGVALFYHWQAKQHDIYRKESVPTQSLETASTEEDKEYTNEGDLESVSVFGAKPSKGTEAYRVHQEVEKKKNLAKEKKVDELISELYFGNIEHYPSWIKHEDRVYVPELITDATKSKERDKKVTKIILNEKEYKFTFKADFFYHPELGDSASTNYGYLELFNGNEKVLELNISIKYKSWGTEYRTTDIKAFIDGEWIEDFCCLKKQKIKDDRARAVKKAEDPEKTEEMKKNFGIE